VQAHSLGEVGILGIVLLRVYSGTLLPIFIEIGSYLTDKEQKISWHSFFETRCTCSCTGSRSATSHNFVFHGLYRTTGQQNSVSHEGRPVTDARSLLLKSYVTAAFRAVSVTENCRATHSQTDEGRLKQLQCQCHTIVIATTVLLIHHKTEGMRD